MSKTASLRQKPRNRRDVWNAKLLRGCSFDGKYEMPRLPRCDTKPGKLTAFSNAKSENADGSFLHTYQDDYKFECIWRNPDHYLSLVQSYGGAIAPDFSVYRAMPLALQLYNVYRSRVIGYWWVRKGITVIPNVRWGDERTYDFCFDGLPKNSVVAVGTHGCAKHKDDKRHLCNGFLVMLDRLQPSTVIIYGSASDRIFSPLDVGNVEIVRFESDFSASRKRGVV
jgi:hypothetical protein